MTDVIGQCSKCGGPNYIGHMCVWAVDNFKFVDRYAELEKRIKALEDKVSPDSPAPASTPTLVEAVGEYFGWMDSGEAYRTGYELQGKHNDTMLQALAREKRIAEKRERLIESYYKGHKNEDYPITFCGCTSCNLKRAYDEAKGAE